MLLEDTLSLFPAVPGREFLVVVACDGIHLTHYLDTELVALRSVYSQEKEMCFKPHLICCILSEM